jgi:hypothetical protein
MQASAVEYVPANYARLKNPNPSLRRRIALRHKLGYFIKKRQVQCSTVVYGKSESSALLINRRSKGCERSKDGEAASSSSHTHEYDVPVGCCMYVRYMRCRRTVGTRDLLTTGTHPSVISVATSPRHTDIQTLS